MPGLVAADIERYAEQHSSPPRAQLDQLAAETRATLASPGMLSGAVEGRLLQTLVWITGARSVLEFGTFSGYSALSMAEALPPDGRIVTCEIDAEHAELARKHIEASSYADRIDIRVGPALETVDSLPGPFDLVFIDADKRNYSAYYEASLRKLARHGLIVVDNTLWSGRVLAPDTDDARAIAEFNDFVTADDRVISVMLTVRDGITLVRHAA